MNRRDFVEVWCMTPRFNVYVLLHSSLMSARACEYSQHTTYHIAFGAFEGSASYRTRAILLGIKDAPCAITSKRKQGRRALRRIVVYCIVDHRAYAIYIYNGVCSY